MSPLGRRTTSYVPGRERQDSASDQNSGNAARGLFHDIEQTRIAVDPKNLKHLEEYRDTQHDCARSRDPATFRQADEATEERKRAKALDKNDGRSLVQRQNRPLCQR